MRRAIVWLHEHLDDYGADPAQIYVAGHSAGGHLTAMTTTLDVVMGAVAISGIYDLEPIRLNYLNEKLALDAAEARRNSQLAQASERIAKVLAMWLIGHETGHAALHDTINFERRRAMTEAQELQADGFFIGKVFAHADKRQRQDIYWGVNQFIFSIYTMTFRGKPSGGSAIVTPSVDDVHPPWVIRALKLGEHMTSLDPNSPKGNDFYKGLGSHIEVEIGGTDVGSFCAATNLREIGAQRQQERLKSPD